MFGKRLIALSRNDYQPDITFHGRPKAKHFFDNQMLFPAPDLIVEILSADSEQRDRGLKFRDYAAHDISEYWMVNPERESIERFCHDGNGYIMQESPNVIRSALFPGLEIPLSAIFDDVENHNFLKIVYKAA
jgi:Uma2 family endonuclease